MIVIHVQVKIKPEKQSDFLELIHQDMEAAQGKPGCATYQWLAHPSDHQTFTLYEEWATEADFDRFRNSAYFQQLNSQFAPIIAEAPRSHYYEATPLTP